MLDKDGHYVRTDMWREGKWLDLWSVVHLLSGVSIGIVVPAFKWPFTSSIVIVFLLLVAYELWEAVVKIEETPQNRIMDVVVGMVAFLPVYGLTAGMALLPRATLFVPVLTINIILATLGWYESHKAAVFEANLRGQLAKRRERRELQRSRKAALRTAQVQSERSQKGVPLA